jgi:hypothetical protein
MTSLVLGDLILESLTPSVNAHLKVPFRAYIKEEVAAAAHGNPKSRANRLNHFQ